MWNPLLLILDIRLPDMSGFDVCRTIRSEGRHEPILMLTARDEEIDKVLGLELGADDYVVKPYQLPARSSRAREPCCGWLTANWWRRLVTSESVLAT